MKSLIVATIESVFAISGVLGVLITSASAEMPESWENLKSSYATCQKTGGELPEFFESVSVEWSGENITFKPMIKDHGEIKLTYYPDGIVRRGEDYHYLADGTIMPDLPAHEASYWDDETLVREEVTYLPDNTYVLETNEFNVGNDGKLTYELIVDDKTMLTAACV